MRHIFTRHFISSTSGEPHAQGYSNGKTKYVIKFRMGAYDEVVVQAGLHERVHRHGTGLEAVKARFRGRRAVADRRR